jgi:hypothetical protein
MIFSCLTNLQKLLFFFSKLYVDGILQDIIPATFKNFAASGFDRGKSYEIRLEASPINKTLELGDQYVTKVSNK